MPLFEALALNCAPTVALDVLIGIASIESGVSPLSFRDGEQLVDVSNPGEGVSAILGAGERGKELGIGLMGLTPARLQTIGVSIADAFDPCVSMRAAAELMTRSRSLPERRKFDPLVVDRLVIRDWWRPDDRFVSGSSYEAAVRADEAKRASVAKREIGGTLPASTEIVNARAIVTVTSSTALRSGGAETTTVSRSASSSEPVTSGGNPPKEPPRWDVFARARSSGVMVFGSK